MFIRIVLSAKIGKSYKCAELGVIVKDDGTMQIDFPRDVDLTKPFTMICEPVVEFTNKTVNNTLPEFIVDPYESS